VEGVLAVTFIFGGGSLFLLAISPVGRAIANRIQGAGSAASKDTIKRLETAHEGLIEEMDHLRQDMVELQERLDFAERLLAQTRESLPRIERPASGA
jgi:hypothetical protein